MRDAVSHGAKVLAGGAPVEGRSGFFFEPTVLADVNDSMAFFSQECFGPLLPIMPVSSVEEAVRLANRSEYGLRASVWTSDLRRGEQLAGQLDVGMVWVNDVNVAFPEAPWSGLKQSGPGLSLSEWAIYEYVHKRHVSVDTSRDSRRYWWYPYQGAPR